MKTQINKLSLLFIFISLLTLTSCEEENNIDALSTFELSEPLLLSPQADFTLNLESQNSNDIVRFEWESANSTGDFLITYTFFIDLLNGDFSEPILSQTTSNNGAETFFELTQGELDVILSNAGFESNEVVSVKWGVRAQSINQITEVTSFDINIRRFDAQVPPNSLFIAGDATETGNDISNAIQLRRLPNADGSLTNIFQLYTSLQGGSTYNFYSSQNEDMALTYTSNGENIEIGDAGINVVQTGVYRITVDFNSETLNLFNIDRWSIVGNVIPDGWNGDQALEYQGNGIWQSTIELIDADPGDANKRFIFRANEDWEQVLKIIPESTNELAFEATAGEFGYTSLEDVPVSNLGFRLITLSLNGNGFSFTNELGEEEEEETPLETPDQLYLSGSATETGSDVSNALLMNRLINEDGSESEIFEIFTSLTGGESYNFFEENIIGSTSYTVNSGILELGSDPITVSETGIYRVSVNFDNATLSLLEITNWSIVGNVIENGWDGDEPLTYQGNGVFQASIELIDADPGDTNKRFIFRANEDWALVFKEIPETDMELAFEGTAEMFGYTQLDDISVSNLGMQQITLTLNGSGYSYTIN
ncbi:SusE domain-containing protein [uncultured Dokdonia sp.]|uniref:SusE domain-containing protein n=1 Tax=uncultured Dokdonia sp. TaxID=575653 RepID=UPI002636E8EE|nr:SusE domain-containing protein [uncultured Dokdonia sp.]